MIDHGIHLLRQATHWEGIGGLRTRLLRVLENAVSGNGNETSVSCICFSFLLGIGCRATL